MYIPETSLWRSMRFRLMPSMMAALMLCLMGRAQERWLGVPILMPDTSKAVRAGDRTRVDLTVYNQGISLVREERSITLPQGTSRVVLSGIPETIDGTSLHFASISDPGGVSILEQNYQYDLVNQEKLLERYLGREVEFVRLNEETKREFSVSGRLLSTGFVPLAGSFITTPAYEYAGGMVAEIGGKVELNPAGRLLLPDLPGGLVLRPQLEWLVNSTRPGVKNVEISYIASGLSWMCDYVALLEGGDTSVDLTGWVTLTNACGSSFKRASLKLVAGDVNLVRKDKGIASGLERADAEGDDLRPQFTQTNLFEYKLYTMHRPADVHDNETKQLELVSARHVAARRIFVYDALQDQWRYWYHNTSYRNQGSPGQPSNPKVGVFVTFRNASASGLGMPLPKGKVRVYKRDSDGREQFVGEDLIDHTPKDEEIRLMLGNAFDIVGDRRQTDFRTFADGHVVEETFEIRLRNHKREQATVLVTEHPWRWSQWEILRSNTAWTKVDPTTLHFPVAVPKDGENVVTYTIRYSW